MYVYLAAMILIGSSLSPAMAADGAAGLRAWIDRCVDLVDEQSCGSALQQSHRLKQLAEKQENYQCYTLILALESHLIMHSLDRNHRPETLAALGEAARVCRW
ncbi:hypothetical protein [Synechococcus sp. GFB01]|uniref:hypothetical protein n=1 Tax=Synechococcus sp. GFB01 TaxID=1662190 RepID=UPI00128C1509|nr:hypothetical protein [Synechococcus sp. GFB01]